MITIGKFIDLTGQNFGKLTVIEPAAQRDSIGSVRWLCRCSCGSETVVSAYNLKSGNTRSCGCLKKERIRVDLTGQIFGKLTVIAPTDQRGSTGGVKWLCKCSCGNEVIVKASNLRNGTTKSCGCLRKERAIEMNKKYNVFEKKGDVCVGYTTSGTTFLIDAEDLDKVSKYCWCENDQGYIRSNIGDRTYVLLHRFVLNINDKRIIDHKNRNKKDNRKTNLRIANKQQNAINCGVYRNNTTGVKGVRKSKNGERYVSYIGKDDRIIHIGTYDTLEEARQARVEKEIELFGEFAFQDEKGGDLT